MARLRGARAAFSAGSGSAVLTVLLYAAGTAQAAPTIGKATSIVPAVSHMSSGQVKALGSGDGVEQDEIIQTETAGNARLRFIDATDLSIGPSSIVRLDKFVFNPAGSASSFVLNATKGAFRFATGNSNHDAYQIRTPAAVIGVRGTQFSFTVIGTKLSLSVLQGRVIVCPIGLPKTRCFEATPGQTISAQPNQPVILVSGGGGRGPTPPKMLPKTLPKMLPKTPQLPRQPSGPPGRGSGSGYGPAGPSGYGPPGYGPDPYQPPPGYGQYPPGGYGPYPPGGYGSPGYPVPPRQIPSRWPPRGGGWPPYGGRPWPGAGGHPPYGGGHGPSYPPRGGGGYPGGGANGPTGGGGGPILRGGPYGGGPYGGPRGGGYGGRGGAGPYRGGGGGGRGRY